MVPEVAESIIEQTLRQLQQLSNLERIEVLEIVIEQLELDKDDCMRTEYWCENLNEDRYE